MKPAFLEVLDDLEQLLQRAPGQVQADDADAVARPRIPGTTALFLEQLLALHFQRLSGKLTRAHPTLALGSRLIFRCMRPPYQDTESDVAELVSRHVRLWRPCLDP